MERKAIILLSSLRTVVRGVAISSLRRAETLSHYNKIDVSVITFDYCEDYPHIINKLRESGYLNGYKFFNIFDYFCSKNFIKSGEKYKSSIAKLLKSGKNISKEKVTKWCFKYSFPDGRNVFEYVSPKSGLVYLRAITLGEHFLWDYTPEIEIVNDDILLHKFYSSREFWGFFIEQIAKDSKYIHLFQDASYVEKGDTRDKFCALKIGERFYNYRVAHGATQVNIRKKSSAAIPSWGSADEYRKDYSAIIFLTENQRNHWIESQGNDIRLIVIPHESGLEDLGYTERKGNRCVYITSLTPLKNVDMAIKAFSLVVEKIPDAVLEIYGQGTEQNKLEILIKELSLEKNVFLKGYSIHAQKSLEGAAVSLLTSERESFGMPILESYAYACPVVSFDVNYGPHELIEEGITGYRVPFGSISEFGKAIIKILLQDEISTQLRKNCYLKAKNYNKAKTSVLWQQLMDQAEVARLDKGPL